MASLDSSSEVECFLDPDNEVFFGPITDREREARKPLPRRTLHPCEITEISKRGMNFHEWEDYKEQIQRNQMNDEAIQEVYGDDEDTTSEESFTSCCTDKKAFKEPIVEDEEIVIDSFSSSASEQSQHDISEVNGSLNDTWEIQERMLALAEKLERGEEIPELGICHHASGKIEFKANANITHRTSSAPKSIVNENGDQSFNEQQLIADDVNQQDQSDHNPVQISNNNYSAITVDGEEGSIVSELSPTAEEKTSTGLRGRSYEELMKELDCFEISADSAVMETPVKTEPEFFAPTPVRQVNRTPGIVHCVLETPVNSKPSSMKTPSSIAKTPFNKKPSAVSAQTNSLKRPAIKQNLSVKSKSVLATPSPVGMYIRSLPEPILIENVRSANKKVIQSTPNAKPVVAVKNKDGRWSVARTPRSSIKKENIAQQPPAEDFKAVLPTVLHEAAAYMISDNPVPSSHHNTPGTQGKIGKLLDRAVTPTVLKHQGRIQVSKGETQSSKIVQSPMSIKSGARSNGHSLMEVSVLEKVSSTKSSIPIRRPFNK